MSIDLLIEDESRDELSRMLLNAFNSYAETESMEGIKDIFGQYYSDLDRIDTFMEQIKSNFFDKIKEKQEIFFSSVLKDAISRYEVVKHEKNTLLYLLDLAIFINLYDIEFLIKNIWEELEEIGFTDESNRAFALNILRYIVSFKNPSSMRGFINMIQNSTSFHLDFAGMILLHTVKEEKEKVPSLLSKFTKLNWEGKEDEDFFNMLSDTLIDEVGLESIVYCIENINDDSAWLVKYILGTKRIEVYMRKEGHKDIIKFRYGNHSIEVYQEDIKSTCAQYDVENFLYDHDNNPASKAYPEVVDKKPDIPAFSAREAYLVFNHKDIA
ncbi:MAG TPA: hypothetical protein EYG73_06305 [Arcobacter sp.]|nr:hypothetical protein [Arcobacter sp.]